MPEMLNLTAILFYANYKVKNPNSAWQLVLSNSACLNYVKKACSTLYPKMPLTCTILRNASSLVGWDWEPLWISMKTCRPMSTYHY